MKFRKDKNIVELIEHTERFDASIGEGLTSEQVELRKSQGLTNKTKKTVTKSYGEIIINNVFSLFNILLYVIAIFMFIAQLYTKMIFVLVLLANIVIGLVQDIRARGIVDKLALVTNPTVVTVRNSKEETLNINELVLDDVIRLKAGDQVPADSKILEGCVHVNESFITGESEPIKKGEGETLFGGSYITSGSIYCVVDKVGNANYSSIIQNKARHFSRPKSEIVTSFNALFKIIGGVVILFAIAEIISYTALKMDFVDLVDSVSGSLVPMIPMGMYLLTSIALTVGVIVLARKKVIVHELYCIEVLARVNVLCLDKTGTLTDGTMEVRELHSIGFTDEELAQNVANLLASTKDENITANALRKKFGDKLNKGVSEVLPFTSEHKYSAITYDDGSTFAMGAFGFLKVSNHNDIKDRVEQYEKEGLRVIIFAKSNKKIKDERVPLDMKAVGIICFQEHIREDAIPTINWFKENDVAIKIISGDSASSVSIIAKKSGIAGAEKAISLDGMSIEKVKEIAPQYNVFGRVSPEQKQAIIQALQKQGDTVAMTGDGVNDILALKTADCSIAMASGADAAKTIAHLVSLDNNFCSLPNVVEEGRRVINNLQRTCSLYLVKTIFAMLVSLWFLISFWINPVNKYPFATSHLYVWEWVTIGLASVCLALQPSKERLQGSFVSNLFTNAFPASVMQSAMVFTMYIFNSINGDVFTPNAVLGVSVFLLILMSYVALFNISLPLNKFRVFVFVIMVAIGMGIMGIDYIMFINGITSLKSPLNSKILDIPYKCINLSTVLLGAIVFFIAVPLYFLIAKHTKKLAIRFSKKGEIVE